MAPTPPSWFRKKEDPLHIPPEGPPQGAPLSPEIYLKMGQAGIMEMIKALYQELGQSPLAGMFPPNLEAAAERSGLFFVQLLGGPPLFHQQFGPPQMRKRHLHFRIDDGARRIWLGCFMKVLEDASTRFGFPDEHLEDFRRFLDGFSRWMVNTA